MNEEGKSTVYSYVLLLVIMSFVTLSGGKAAWEIVMAGLRAVMGHITYERIADHGPKYGAVTEKRPLTTEYVTTYTYLTISELSWHIY